jgi:phosphoglycolate phosphatase
MKKVIVYDCDGVLFDSTQAVKAYYDNVFEKFSLPPADWNDEATLKLAMMSTNSEIIAHFCKDESKYNEIMEYATKLNFRFFLDKMIPETGIFDALDKLKSKGYSLAVCTNRGVSIDPLLKHFDMYKYFDRLVCSFDVVRPKPHPEGLIKIADFFSVKKENMLFLGDSEADYKAAKSAPVPFLAFGNDL